jgi:hypothetical protein
MPVDVKYLREHYASLSDEALSAIGRADLVKEAQQCYDDEVARRKRSRLSVADPDPVDEEPEADTELPGDGETPGWLEEATEVYSRSGQPGSPPADDVADARDFLEAEGIPCYLELVEEEQSDAPSPAHRWRVLVPGNFNLRATSILERDILNSDVESGWRTLLETLPDDELREMKPEVAFCGLFDKVERVTRVYEEEIARRKLRR